jgi:hypothetical protein
MQYLLLVYVNEGKLAELSEDETRGAIGEYIAVRQEMVEKKQYVGANRLAAVATATTVRRREGKTVVTDGPFAETKEQLAGYFLVEAQNLDEAIALAERFPAARIGSVEVRPVVPVPAPLVANA